MQRCSELVRDTVYTGVCHYCSHKSRFYFGCPVGIDRSTNTITLAGYFCGLACLAAHIEYGYRDRVCERTHIQQLFELYAIVNFRTTVLEPAPCREELQLFGGTMTIEEFRSLGGLRQYVSPKPSMKRATPKLRYRVNRVASMFNVKILRKSGIT